MEYDTIIDKTTLQMKNKSIAGTSRVRLKNGKIYMS